MTSSVNDKIATISAYTTSDGKVHASLDVAREHQTIIEMRHIFDTNYFGVTGQSADFREYSAFVDDLRSDEIEIMISYLQNRSSALKGDQ